VELDAVDRQPSPLRPLQWGHQPPHDRKAAPGGQQRVGATPLQGQRPGAVRSPRLDEGAHVQYIGQRLILPALGAPDEVYLEALPHGTQVGLVYRPRPASPAVAGSRVGLLLTEARGSFDQNPAYFKGLGPGTQVEVTQVNGAPAYWLTGKPHLFWYTDATGAVTTERIRLAGNTLLWAHGGLIFRLESALPREAALRIAASLR
jgi:hypothetical protein